MLVWFAFYLQYIEKKLRMRFPGLRLLIKETSKVDQFLAFVNKFLSEQSIAVMKEIRKNKTLDLYY